MKNKKILFTVCTFFMFSNIIPSFAQDLPTLSTPTLGELSTPSLSSSFQDLRTNINKDGNLPNLPSLQKLPDLDESGFTDIEKQFKKGTKDLTKQGFGKKVEIKNSTSTNDSNTLFENMNNLYTSKTNDLQNKITQLPEAEIKNKLASFKSSSTDLLNSLSANAENTLNSKKNEGAGLLAQGDSAFEQALQNKMSLNNFDDIPDCSVPSWLYQPSSKITGMQDYIATDSSDVNNSLSAYKTFSANNLQGIKDDKSEFDRKYFNSKNDIEQSTIQSQENQQLGLLGHIGKGMYDIGSSLWDVITYPVDRASENKTNTSGVPTSMSTP